MMSVMSQTPVSQNASGNKRQAPHFTVEPDNRGAKQTQIAEDRRGTPGQPGIQSATKEGHKGMERVEDDCVRERRGLDQHA